MPSRDLDQIATTASPAARQAQFIGQATAIEQARAVAEVQAAVVVAQQVPRDLQAAIAAMRESTDHLGLAERAFFAYSRAGSSITGPTIHIARELARVWGNVQYGIAELRRDDDAGISEMQAYAWDVQTNTRAATIFIVPHRRDTKQGVKPIVELRDVYENNANQGARRVREQIFAILPPWFKDEALDRCSATLRRGADGGQPAKPLARRVADAIALFEGLGVTVDQLEARVDRPRPKWNDHDVAQLAILYRSLQRGEVRREEEFPQRRVTADEITAQTSAAAPPPEPPPAEPSPDEAAGQEPDPNAWDDVQVAPIGGRP